MSEDKQVPPPDQDQRARILTELGSNMLVEAAAGTGKTTSMVGRMVALLRTGHCKQVSRLAAVTFTRKAAAELRGRFQVELEKAVRHSDGAERERLRAALGSVDQCFIGTIHSFCGRLLRERPVEAGVALDFNEADDSADLSLREEAWELAMARFIAQEGEPAAELESLGLSATDLKSAFLKFADYPDVEEWPVDEGLEPPDWDMVHSELMKYIRRMEALLPELPEDPKTDKLIPEYRRLPRLISHYTDLAEPKQLVDALSLFDHEAKIIQYAWNREELTADASQSKSTTRATPEAKAKSKAEELAWNTFREETVIPVLTVWRAMRYAPCLRVLMKAREVYDELRRTRGMLNFQDLLMKAADLLRSGRHVREYFARRFTHLLVDEFQDTDPIQAEVMLLLTADDPSENRWRECRPRPGSIFVVGDPKQSIYRFRRADIVTYNAVKSVIEHSPNGSVVELSANFRATPGMVDWVNSVFKPGANPKLCFPDAHKDESPAYVFLQAVRPAASPGEWSGVKRIEIPKEKSGKKEYVTPYETPIVARAIRKALDEGWPLPRSEQEIAQGVPPAARPSDFLILTRTKKNLSLFANALQELGVPHQVTGGTSLNENRELRLLLHALRAVVHSDAPVALVAALRSELFGVSDAALYAYKKAGGRFFFNCPVPDSLPEDRAAPIRDAFGLLQRAADWMRTLPPPAAIERLARALGLHALAASRPGGDVQAGTLAKGIELLRQAHRDSWTAAQVVEQLERMVSADAKGESADGISAKSAEEPAVRVMNLHKAKGLEAPVVFLADATGRYDFPPDIRIDRSGDKTVGYMAIFGVSANRHQPLLAKPLDWDHLHAQEEKKFRDAEECRVRYVAATRAGAALVVSQREKRPGDNPWQVFKESLLAFPCLFEQIPEAPLASAPPADRPAPETLDPEAAVRAAAEADARLARIGSPTYAVKQAKEFSPSEPAAAPTVGPAEAVMQPADPGEGEHGIAWGEVVHALLELARVRPKADLLPAARAALEERNMEPGNAPAAVQTVQAVLKSVIWRRADAAPQCHAEAPFHALRQTDGLAAVVRGCIDLVFREEKGWVVIDYKTDDIQPGQAPAAAKKHAPQLRFYAAVWEECSGEKVAETGVLFLRTGEYVVVGR